MDVNPFLNWLLKPGVGKKGETYYIPDLTVLPQIYDHFGATEEQFATLKLRDELIDLWSKSKIRQNGFKIVDGRIEGARMVGEPRAYREFRVQYVKGFVCTPDLKTRLVKTFKEINKKSLGSATKKTPQKTIGNDNNPFNELDYQYLPDMSYVPELYAELGVKSFGQTGLTTLDYAQAFEETNPKDFSKTILDTKGTKLYLSKFPRSVVKRLAVRVANLQKADSYPTRMTKDVHHLIAGSELTGKDLIAFCIAHRNINKFCNDALFIRHLVDEFGIDWKLEQHGYKTPRELYVQLHKEHIEVVQDPNDPEDWLRAIVVKEGELPFRHKVSYLLPRRKITVPVIAFIFPLSPLLSFLYYPKSDEFEDSREIQGIIGTIRLHQFCKQYYDYFRTNLFSFAVDRSLMTGRYLPHRDPVTRFVGRGIYATAVETDGLAWYGDMMGPDAPLYLKKVEILKK
uniref:Uncharacterized protein n=1 Tax=viral metagenome TaxID=1070528 RepID=A0A6C0CF98_9ZZZZ